MGAGWREVVRVPGYLEHSAPRFSHDGRRLVFAVAHDAMASKLARKFYIVNVDGSELKQVETDMMPDWSPDDKQFVFHHNPGDGEASTIFAAEYRRGGPHRAGGRKKPAMEPRWQQAGGARRADVAAWNLADDAVGDLLAEPVEQVHSGYTWSADSKRIAVTVTPAEGITNRLLIIEVDGAEPRVRTRLEGDIGGVVCWSPDGKRLLYERDERLYILDVAGAGPGQEIPGQKGRTFHGDWSPDGKWIAFSSDRK